MGTKDRDDESDGHERRPSPGDDRVVVAIKIIATANSILDAVILVGDITGRVTLATIAVARATLTLTEALLTACKHRQR